MAENAALALAQLSLTEKYSDLKLVCEDKEFKVHKVVVCTQSPVISAACDGGFQEAATNMLHIKAFDPLTVKRMIEYLYTKEYKVNLEDYCSGDSETECQLENDRDNFTQPGNDQSTNSNGNDDGGSDGEDNGTPEGHISETLIGHVRVNAIADYYDIPPLKELANKEIQEILWSRWTADGFCDVVKEVFNSTGDNRLREIMASATADHIAELIQLEEFARLPVLDPFSVNTMKKIATNITETMTTMKNLVGSAEAAETKSKRNEATAEVATELNSTLKQAYNNATRLLSRTKKCRNINCTAEFSCRLEEDTSPHQVLRCSKCNCKHQL